MSVQLNDAGVVVTGAARGIGEALARRFAAAGARLVLTDVDELVTSVATELGAKAVVGDVTEPADMITQARAELGEIDLFCANAGIAPLGAEDTPEDVWANAWNVNVMAHIRAANALLPAWLERGRGHFLATVSAAGLLTSLGSAPYSVTKHGALAFAEWLSATYRHRGIGVQALCPQGVRTRMYEQTGAGGQLLMGPSLIEAPQVADLVAEKLATDEFLILPHPEVAEYYTNRATQTDRWLAGMNKLQQKVEQLGPQ